MKAVILAAGEGRRLRPLTRTRPKPMLPVANRPLLEHIIAAVADAGIDEIVLVVGYRRERIQNHFGDGNAWEVDLTYVEQEPQLGTGHALLQAEPHLGGDFVALNGDRIIDSELIAGVRDHHAETEEIVMAITEVDEPERYGVVKLDGDRVSSVIEQPPAEFIRSSLINAGVYGFGPDIFAALRDTETVGELGITTTLRELLDDRPVRAYRYAGPWLDVSTPWDLLNVSSSVIDRGGEGLAESAMIDDAADIARATAIGANASVGPNASILRGTAIGEHASIGPNVVLADTIVLPDATVHPGAVLRRCIVGANTEIGAGTVVADGWADIILDGAVHEDVRFGGLIGDNSTVGGNVTIAPGTVLGNDVRVADGAAIDGPIDDGADIVRG